MEFCKTFNAHTQNLEPGMPIPVVITAYGDSQLHLRDQDAAGLVFPEKGRRDREGVADHRQGRHGRPGHDDQVREIAQQKMWTLMPTTSTRHAAW